MPITGEYKMSKIVKGVKKAVSKVWKGVKKVFKEVVSSKIGKIILIAAAIYMGGVAMGAWGGGGTAGAAVGAEAGVVAGTEMAAADDALAAEIAATDSVVAAGSGGVFTGTAAAPTAGQVAAAEVAAPTAFSGGAAAPATGGEAAAAEVTASNAFAPTVTKEVAKESMLKGLGTWVSENPGLAMMGGMAMSSAFTPDPNEALIKEEKRKEAARNKNLDVSGVKVGMTPTNTSTSTSNSVINGTPRRQTS